MSRQKNVSSALKRITVSIVAELSSDEEEDSGATVCKDVVETNNNKSCADSDKPYSDNDDDLFVDYSSTYTIRFNFQVV